MTLDLEEIKRRRETWMRFPDADPATLVALDIPHLVAALEAAEADAARLRAVMGSPHEMYPSHWWNQERRAACDVHDARVRNEAQP